MSVVEADTRTWRLGFETLETETDAELEVRGELPADLRGTLYRIGPARHDVYGERYRHWFDGDGMVHAISIDAGRVHYRNRFVETDKKRDEDLAQRRLYGAFGTPPTGRPLQRIRRAVPKSAANTNVVFHAGKLLALWEAGRPWRIDPVTLETLGEDDLGGALAPGRAISAHPKYDRSTGEMWNFGVDYGPRTAVSLYRTGADGTTNRLARLPLPFSAMIHDFALTESKVVLVIAPIALPWIPAGVLAGRRSFGQSLRWRPGRGTRIWVVDRRSGEVAKYRTDAFMMFHTANAFDDGEDVVVDLSAYEDASIMRLFTEVMVGRPYPGAIPRLERLRVGPRGVERHRISDVALEFPRVASLCTEHKVIYGVGQLEGSDFIGAPVAVEASTGRATYAPVRPWQFAGELVAATKAGANSEAGVWLLSVVLDAEKQTSELWVMDGDDLSGPPVAVITLPHVVPFGFHGNWVRS